MRLGQLIVATLRHYWRTNLAIVAGVATATGVIGGALLVGDSVRSSLQQMTLERLADVDHVLTGGRFFRERLAEEVAAHADESLDVQVAPGIVLPGSASVIGPRRADGAVAPRRAGNLQVFGVDRRFWRLTRPGAIKAPMNNEVVLNRRLADELGVDVGANVSLLVEIPPSIPRDSLLGERNETVAELPVRVKAIADDELTQGRFGLNPSQQLPRNAFVALDALQDRLGLEEVRRATRNRPQQPARVNTLFVHARRGPAPTGRAIEPETADRLTGLLRQTWSLEDVALRIVQNPEHGYCSLESAQLLLDDAVVAAAERSARELELTTAPVFVYLINSIANANNPDAYSMYPVAAGIEFTDQPPFGPFEWQSAPDEPLREGDVVLNDWLAEDLKVARGDTVTVDYYEMGSRGELPEIHRSFRVAGIVRLTGPADDQGFTPRVPGITDVESLRDWRQPFPLQLNRVTRRDDEYWDPHDLSRKAYRATPKVFLPLEHARKLWPSRYGRLTSFRFAPPPGQTPGEAARDFQARLLAELSPDQTGLLFRPVKHQGLEAARGTTDFAGLFVGFSIFLIAAAAILVGLLFRLSLEQRLSELGLLSALGFSAGRLRRLILFEGGVLLAAGGLLGSVLAVAFAALMIRGLTTWWIGAVGTRFLTLKINPLSLANGFAIALTVAAIAIATAIRRTHSASTRDLLSGTTEPFATEARRAGQRRAARRWAAVWAGLAGVLLLASAGGLVPPQEAFAGLAWTTVVFFIIGIAALLCSLSLLADRLNGDQSMAVHGRGAVLRLALRNAGRQRGRSLLTAGLIGAATFVIVAIAAGHRNPAAEEPVRRSGNGGYSLVAETAVPLLFNLNTQEGRAKLGVDVPDARIRQLLERTHVAALRVRPGEDASCLNLYRTQLPTILGVPQDVLHQWFEEGRFRFVGAGRSHPWPLLEHLNPDGTIPVIGDVNTLQYSLHLGVGETIDVPQSGAQLRIAAMLDGSVFQGVLLMSEAHFLRLFPNEAGFRYFLIDTDPAESARVSNWLETELADYGFDAQRVVDRLASFLAVQNTYLSTFQTLGGLGLLLGTFGLGTVMLRNVLERRGELALMRAVGFRNPRVAALVLCENAWLMVWGLGAGTVAALLAMTPHLSSTGADVPWRGLILMLAAVAVAGMTAAVWAVRAAVGGPIVAALRGE